MNERKDLKLGFSFFIISPNQIMPEKKTQSVSSCKPKKGKSVSTNRKFSTPIVFHCAGGEILRMDIRCCYESELIATMYSLRLVHFAISRFNAHILSLVNDFCIRRWEIFEACSHDERLFLDALGEFGVKFLQQHPPDVLEQLMDAAHELRIVNLLDMIGKFLGKPSDETSGIKGKSVLTGVGWKVVMESMCPPMVVDDAHLSNCASLRYDCLDDKIVNVNPRCCYESEHVYRTLAETVNEEKDTDYGEVVVGDIGRRPTKVQIPSKILSMVNYFCMSHFYLTERYGDDDKLFSDMLEFFDCCFVQSQTPSLVVQLMQAAYEMKIQSLLDLTRNAIVPKLDKKSADEILKIFNLPDFDHKVWEEAYLLEAIPVKKMMIF